MNINYTIIKKNSIIPNIWDGGETFEYLIYPENSLYAKRDFLIRISVATITKVPSVFTKFKGYARFLVMLDNDLNININGKEESYTPNNVFKFDSNSDITSFTKGNDFNLMVQNNVDANVCLVNDAIDVSVSMTFVFAKTQTKLFVNATDFILEPFDLLIIENTNSHKLTITTDKNIIIAYISKKIM